jgi:UDP-glucose:(heptosyl)LPS alpha-1,3-glucosyltransferase
VKFAFCLFRYFPFGGLQRDFLRIAKECLLRGHQIDVYTMAWEGDFEHELNIHIFPANGVSNHARVKHYLSHITPYLSGYDLVVGFNKMPGLDVYYAADTCYQAKAREQRSAWYRLTPRYRQLVAFEEAVFKSSSTRILILSLKQQDDFMKYYQTPLERFHLLPPGIARDRMAPDNAKEIKNQLRYELQLKDDELLLLMVGSGFKTKGLDRLLIAYAALPEELQHRSKIYIIGNDNPCIFQKLATRLGIGSKIHFLGGRHDVARFFLAADLLLHPAYNENTGTVLLEAMAAGLPVLTTDVCGYAHYIKKADAGKVLSSPFCQEDFNQTMTSMLLSRQRDTWRKNAVHYAKQADIYRLPQCAADYIETLSWAKSS